MTEAFYVLFCTDEVLNVSILSRGSGENWVVNNDTMDRLVGIGINYFLLNVFLLYSLKAKLEATEEESVLESCKISAEGRRVTCGGDVVRKQYGKTLSTLR